MGVVLVVSRGGGHRASAANKAIRPGFHGQFPAFALVQSRAGPVGGSGRTRTDRHRPPRPGAFRTGRDRRCGSGRKVGEASRGGKARPARGSGSAGPRTGADTEEPSRAPPRHARSPLRPRTIREPLPRNLVIGPLVAALLALLGGPPARAEEGGGGTLLLRHGGAAPVEAPRLAADAAITVSGPTARATITQAFRNTTTEWVEGTYLFPLPEDAAVDAMRLVVGDRVIVADIRERQAARRAYEAARDEGKAAALTEQQRPNLFTNAVANIAPGETVLVQIQYQQSVRRSGDTYSLRLPTVAAPRYSPARRSCSPPRTARTIPGPRPTPCPTGAPSPRRCSIRRATRRSIR